MLSEQTFIGMLNVMISEICITRSVNEKQALNDYIIPFLVKEVRSRDVALMGQKDLEVIRKSVESLKATKKEINLLKNVVKTLEELMHGKD